MFIKRDRNSDDDFREIEISKMFAKVEKFSRNLVMFLLADGKVIKLFFKSPPPPATHPPVPFALS